MKYKIEIAPRGQIIRTKSTARLVISKSTASLPSKVSAKKAASSPHKHEAPHVVPRRTEGKPNAVRHKHQFINKTNKVTKSKGVTYVTRGISEESKKKIYALQNVGQGRKLVIIGNGPSINTIDLSLIKSLPNVDVMSINKPDMRVWPTKYWAFADGSQYRSNQQLWEDYDGIIINSTSISQQKEKSLQVKNVGAMSFARNIPEGLCIGRSTVYAMMQMALWMNYDQIIIFGVDMNPSGINGQLHFYGQNKHVDDEERRRRFKEEAKYYDHAAEVLPEDIRKRFYFCSEHNPWQFPDKFNRLSASDGLKMI